MISHHTVLIVLLILLLKTSSTLAGKSFSATQDDSVLEGTWDYHDELYEEHGFWACPHVTETYTSPKHWWHGFKVAYYIPPPGKILLTLQESTSILTKLLGVPILKIVYAGDSLSRQKFFASICATEKESLPIESYHIHSRFLAQNPCGCFAANNTDNHYTSQNFPRCEKDDDPRRWTYYEDTQIAVFNGGAWFTPYYLGCFNENELEASYEQTLIELIPTLQKYIDDGKIVIWFTLPHSISKRTDFAHQKFKTRNSVARRIFSALGILFIDPYEMFLNRIQHDQSIKCDDLHFCGFGPESPNVFEVRLIMHYAARSLENRRR